MKIDFRQGIISARSITGTPDFLEYNPQNNTMTIDITDTRLVVTAAYKAVNYTYEHRETLDSAFGPLEWKAKWGTEPDKPTYYFYWNFDMGTGQVTLGYSPCDPSYGYTYPANPGIDQHFYNLNEMVMYYYTGSQWIPCIRVFAGSISLNNKVIVHKPFGTQVGFSKALGTMTANEAQTGYILYGMDMKAIRTQEGTFFTTVTNASTYHGSFSSPIRLELQAARLPHRKRSRSSIVLPTTGTTPSDWRLVLTAPSMRSGYRTCQPHRAPLSPTCLTVCCTATRGTGMYLLARICTVVSQVS
jgi:hypothetical protein